MLSRWTKPCQILSRTMDRLTSDPTFELETDEQFQHYHRKKQILSKNKICNPADLIDDSFLRCHQYCIPGIGEARILLGLDRSAQAG